jgi:hypothetical protein
MAAADHYHIEFLRVKHENSASEKGQKWRDLRCGPPCHGVG